MSGLVLTAFVVTHLLNLALGLISLSVAESWRHILMAPWRSVTGVTFLAFSAGVHAFLGLYSISQRRSFTLSRADILQIVLGVFTPPLLATHVLTMWLTGVLVAGFDSTYGMILAVYWSFAPIYAFQQLIVVVLVWTHAAIGLYSFLSLRKVWPRIRVFVLAVLFLVPIIALLGFAEAGKEVLIKLATDEAWRSHVQAPLFVVAEHMPTLNKINATVMSFYWFLVVIAFSAWFARGVRSNKRVQVDYGGGTSVSAKVGLSILEVSLINGIPHAHLCHGRGRCGTCRINIIAGKDNISNLSELEQKTLLAVGAARDERLACQAIILKGKVSVSKIIPPYADLTAAHTPEIWQSSEIDIAQSPFETLPSEVLNP